MIVLFANGTYIIVAFYIGKLKNITRVNTNFKKIENYVSPHNLINWSPDNQ